MNIELLVRAAHPRVGGADGSVVVAPGRVAGSPPRGRGGPDHGVVQGSGCGLTPAWAGRTSFSNLSALELLRLTPAWAGRTNCGAARRPRRRAHPRVGGADYRPVETRTATMGSPPRGRGGHRRIPSRLGTSRLTPAWAGRTAQTRRKPNSPPAHPRVGGADSGTKWSDSSEMGSPPRGRGGPVAVAIGGDPLRLTPAWAGRTLVGARRPARSWAHPRVGGADPAVRDEPCPARGSPPRGRGGRSHRDPLAPDLRLTPAWAGRTGIGDCADQLHQAHPRVGGADLSGGRWCSALSGSPPRGRGGLFPLAGGPDPRGLTPAWAGRTRPASPRSQSPWAHPRVGGADRTRAVVQPWASGSPPRGRGGLEPLPQLLHHPGLTPAWAGRTRVRGRTRSPIRAHPRVGGADYAPLGRFEIVQGSPPRGRGGPGAHHRGPPHPGLTPAWAGRTRRQAQDPPLRTAHPRVGGADRSRRVWQRIGIGSPPRGRGGRQASESEEVMSRLTPAWAGRTRTPARRQPQPGAHPRVGGADVFAA